MSNSRQAAMRVLDGAHDAVARLRLGNADPESTRATALVVADAIDSSLRRLLRDDPGQPMHLRLAALAPDELSAENVVSALRQRDRVTIELAAAFHDLLGVRRRLEHGVEPTPRDVELVVQLADRAEREVRSEPLRQRDPDVASLAGSPEHARQGAASADETQALPPRTLTHAGLGLPWYWGAAAVGALLLFALGLWWTTSRSQPHLDEAIALFRTGDFDQAAEHFQRFAERRPSDPTPRLYLARIHRRTGRFEEAREQLRLAFEHSPDDAALHRELGFLLLESGHPESAVARFRGALDRDRDSVEGWIGLVRALRESGQSEAADRVLSSAPSEVRALMRQEALQPNS